MCGGSISKVVTFVWLIQDSQFVNVNASNLFWSEDGRVITSGLTFRNVTTAGARWDSRGAVTGAGDGEAIVKPWRDRLSLPESAEAVDVDSTAPGAVPTLGPDDPWLKAVQEVRFDSNC